MPCYSKTQKLSKIETLRLARNYIWALSEVLETGQTPEGKGFVEMLCKGLSQPTSNLVAGCLHWSSVRPPGKAWGEIYLWLCHLCPQLQLSISRKQPSLWPYEAHLINLKPPVFKSLGESSFRSHPPDCSTPPYERPPPPLSISGNFSLKQDGSPDLDKSYSFMPHYPAASLSSEPRAFQLLFRLAPPLWCSHRYVLWCLPPPHSMGNSIQSSLTRALRPAFQKDVRRHFLLDHWAEDSKWP